MVSWLQKNIALTKAVQCDNKLNEDFFKKSKSFEFQSLKKATSFDINNFKTLFTRQSIHVIPRKMS